LFFYTPQGGTEKSDKLSGARHYRDNISPTLSLTYSLSIYINYVKGKNIFDDYNTIVSLFMKIGTNKVLIRHFIIETKITCLSSQDMK